MADFDQHVHAYDSWFLDNENLLMSELELVKFFLEEKKEILSVGCGSGLFEMLLKKEYNIDVHHGIEPSRGMAEVARERGMEVEISEAETTDFGNEKYDIVMFNGSPSYIKDLNLCIKKAHGALKEGGKIVVIDVPKESGYATLYNLAKTLKTWDHPLLENISPINPYPIELVELANWRTTEEKVKLLEQNGFHDFQFAQTLLTHPLFSNKQRQPAVIGYDSGDYVAICAEK